MQKTNVVLVLSLFAGGCAVEDDTETTSLAATSAPILLAQSGTGQDREVTSTFDPLVVTLTTAGGTPIANATITFTSPVAGASATFQLGGQIETDASGRAELRAYANTVAGTYTVWAHADGASPMPFVLTNMAGAPAQLVTVLGESQARKTGRPFPYPLTVAVRDNWGNAVEGAPVQFVAPASGATTRMTDDGATLTDDAGHAAVFATAGDLVGTYAVTAKVAGAPSVTFQLANLASDLLTTSHGGQPLHAVTDDLVRE